MASIVINKIKAWSSSFFVDTDGYVYGFGNNQYGQLGNGTISKYLYPVRNGMQFPKEIYTGEHHTVFVLANGTAYACGNNQYGQLGIGTKSDFEASPKMVLLSNVDSVAFAGCYSIYRQVGGIYSISGAAPTEKYERNSPVVPEDLGALLVLDHDSFIRTKDNSDGRMQIIGKNTYGELGNMTTDPVYVFEKRPLYTGLDKVSKIVAGGEHVVYLTEDGSVFTVGSNDKHQLGYLSPRTKMSTPAILDVSNIIDIAAGYEHTLLLTEDGILLGFGSNQNGQLGLGDTKWVETPMQLMEDVLHIYCGEFNSFVVRKDGVIFVTGYNKEGNLGVGSTVECPYFTPLEDFIFDTTVKEIDPPDDVQYEYEKGHIKHTIEVIYSHMGSGNIKSECYINTPSMNQRKKFGQDIFNTFKTHTINTMASVCKENADNFIRKAKDYIDDNTIYHRDAVYVTKTIIRFNNGATLEREGSLTEANCKEIATNYIKDKYRIETDKIRYYSQSKFNELEIYGDPTWTPSKGSKTLILTELNKEVYNYY